jgi:cobalt/nickel transport system ATP-binding protein
MITVTDLRFRYENGLQALAGVSFFVAAGEKIGLIGPNGAGKSSLIQHLNGLLPDPLPATSAVRIDGIPVTLSHAAEIRRRVGMVFQKPDDQLFGSTVREDVAFGPRQLGLSPEAAEDMALASLQRVGATDLRDRIPDELSEGQKRRVCLAGVLACSPQVLLLDEPTSDLDPRSKRELTTLLRELPQTRIIASHDLEWLLGNCTRILLLSGGVLVADGPAEEILSRAEMMEAHGLEVPPTMRYRT